MTTYKIQPQTPDGLILTIFEEKIFDTMKDLTDYINKLDKVI